MDQTPVFVSMEGKSTLSSKGEKTVIICASNSNTKCATVAAAITTNGDKFPPLIVFKGVPHGWIARNNLLHVDTRACYLCQKMLGWMRQ